MSTGRPALPPEDIFGNTKKIRYILDRLEQHRNRLGRPLTVLDFGCGNGTALGRFLCNGPDRYYGVDIHEPSLEYARSHFGTPNATFVSALPGDVTFDALLYGDVIEHLDDPLTVLREHARQLHADGVVVGSVPNGYGPCEIEKYLNRKLHLFEAARFLWRGARRLARRSAAMPAAIPYNLDSGHVQFFSLRSLRKMIDDAGFEIRDFAHGGFVGADFSGSTFLRPRPFVSFNVWVADFLPSWIVSTWYFELSRKMPHR